MNYKKNYKNILILSTVTAILFVSLQDALAQMPIRPMPGTPGVGPRPPQPSPYPQPAPYPQPQPIRIRPMPGPMPQPQPYPQPAPVPVPYPQPAPYPTPNIVRSSLSISSITRRSGGEWKQILLSPQIVISSVELRASFANLMIHEIQIIDNSGRSFPVNNMNEVMIDQNLSIPAFGLESFGVVAAINIRAESFGGNADLEITTSSDQFTQLSLRDLTPGPQPAPFPQPGPYPQPGQGTSLSGYCQDFDHSQFTQARDFAYATSGLDMNSNDSVNWALNFNQTHDCGTITEYSNRYKALYDLAYRTSGLDMSSVGAKAYALDRVEYFSLFQIQANSQTLTAIKNFAYSTSGLDFDSLRSQNIARLWIDRGNCGDTNLISSMSNEYRRQYNFAYSTSGLNYNSIDARNYAVQQIQNFSVCTDLFR